MAYGLTWGWGCLPAIARTTMLYRFFCIEGTHLCWRCLVAVGHCLAVARRSRRSPAHAALLHADLAKQSRASSIVILEWTSQKGIYAFSDSDVGLNEARKRYPTYFQTSDVAQLERHAGQQPGCAWQGEPTQPATIQSNCRSYATRGQTQSRDIQ